MSHQSNRKAFSKELYQVGLQAEEFILNQIKANPECFGITNMKKTIIVNNPDIYGVDILILEMQPDRLWKPVLGIEVMVRQTITYQQIYIESNKLRFCKDASLPTWFIIVNKEFTEALVLSGDKAKLDSYSTATTNFNSGGTDEINIVVPREQFETWELTSA